MIQVDVASTIVEQFAQQLVSNKGRREESVELNEKALGRVLSQDFQASWPIPRVPTSIKDGYAVKSHVVNAKEKGFAFPIVGQVVAGGPGLTAADEDQVCYITTGGAVPAGFNAVVEVEQTNLLGGGAKLDIASRSVAVNQDIRLVGSDIPEGEVLIRKGEIIDAAKIGILAMFGQSKVQVYAKPRVGILSTGDEVLDCKSPETSKDTHGQIYDANRPMLLACASEGSSGGAAVVDLGIVRDQNINESDDSWLQTILTKHQLDILVTSGGVSMGNRDFVRSSIERTGTIHVEKLFMKPGKPLVFATIPNAEQPETLVFGVPGNPVSSLVTFQLLVVPAIRILAGWSQPQHAQVSCALSHDIKLDPVRPEYHRARLENGDRDLFQAKSTGFQRSSNLSSMVNADALLKLPPGPGQLAQGTRVQAILINDIRCQSLLMSCGKPSGAKCNLKIALASSLSSSNNNSDNMKGGLQSTMIFKALFSCDNVQYLPDTAAVPDCCVDNDVVIIFNDDNNKFQNQVQQLDNVQRVPGMEEVLRSYDMLCADIVYFDRERSCLVISLFDDMAKMPKLQLIWPSVVGFWSVQNGGR